MWEELEKKNKLLDKAINDLAKNGYDLAQKEKEYKIAINKKALELRANDYPVTLINQIIYGFDDIANLRFNRDVAEVKYNTNQEYINTIKLQIRILENQLRQRMGEYKMKIKQIFCKHNYKKIAYRLSTYTSDVHNCWDFGCYNDELYKCTKCGKEKIKIVQNEKHPLYHEWKKVDD